MKKMVSMLGLLILSLSGLSMAADLPGKKIYDTKCASCHGPDHKGKPSMAKVFKVDPLVLDLTDEATTSKSDEALTKITTDGIGKMPAYKTKLTSEEIKSIVAFMRFVAPPVKKAEVK